MTARKLGLSVALFGIGAVIVACSTLVPDLFSCGTGAGQVKDEALCVGRQAESFPAADEDYFRDMDYGVTQHPDQVAAALDPYLPGIAPDAAVNAVVKGRNNWIVWTGGNDRFWNILANKTVGNLDFLKTLSNHPGLNYSRDNRWR